MIQHIDSNKHDNDYRSTLERRAKQHKFTQRLGLCFYCKSKKNFQDNVKNQLRNDEKSKFEFKIFYSLLALP